MSLCGPCNAQKKQISAVFFCNDCENELLCAQCRERHNKQKKYKDHVLQEIEKLPTNCSDEDRELLCDVCKAMEKTNKASSFCPECENELLCAVCEEYHKAQKGTRMHKLQHLSRYRYNAENSFETLPALETPSKYKPGKPTATSIGFESITLHWSKPEAFDEGAYFQISCKDSISKTWTTFNEKVTYENKTITNLKSETQYSFRVRVIHNDWEGPYSDVSEGVKTVKSAASTIIERSSCLSKTDPMPRKYALPMEQKYRDETNKIRTFEFGSPHKGSFVEKTIMVVGETGTGKSTLIDGMANYILGVGWDDLFRFKMVSLESEEESKSANQAMSQTEWVSVTQSIQSTVEDSNMQLILLIHLALEIRGVFNTMRK